MIEVNALLCEVYAFVITEYKASSFLSDFNTKFSKKLKNLEEDDRCTFSQKFDEYIQHRVTAGSEKDNRSDVLRSLFQVKGIIECCFEMPAPDPVGHLLAREPHYSVSARAERKLESRASVYNDGEVGKGKKPPQRIGTKSGAELNGEELGVFEVVKRLLASLPKKNLESIKDELGCREDHADANDHLGAILGLLHGFVCHLEVTKDDSDALSAARRKAEGSNFRQAALLLEAIQNCTDGFLLSFRDQHESKLYDPKQDLKEVERYIDELKNKAKRLEKRSASRAVIGAVNKSHDLFAKAYKQHLEPLKGYPNVQTAHVVYGLKQFVYDARTAISPANGDIDKNRNSYKSIARAIHVAACVAVVGLVVGVIRKLCGKKFLVGGDKRTDTRQKLEAIKTSRVAKKFGLFAHKQKASPDELRVEAKSAAITLAPAA